MYDIWFNNLNIKIEKLNDVFLNIFGIEVYWYGFLISLAFISAILLVVKEAKRTKQNVDDYLDLAVYILIFSILGARLYYVLFNLDYYLSNPVKIFNIREGGLAIYGGVIACTIVGYFYTKKKNLKFLKMADTIMPSVILGQAIGRWGNFFNKEAFGSYTDSIFSMRILIDSSTAIGENLKNAVVTSGGYKYLQVHPTFLYESTFNMLIFIFLFIYREKFKKFDGEILSFYLILYGVVRFFVEGLRTDQLLIYNYAVSQIVSIVAIIIGTVIYVKRRKHGIN